MLMNAHHYTTIYIYKKKNVFSILKRPQIHRNVAKSMYMRRDIYEMK